MVSLLLLPLLWGGSLQETRGYELRLKEDVTVQEGLCVHVPCSFSYPWSSWSPPFELYMYWYRSRDNIRQIYPVATNNPRVPVRPETSGRFRLLEDPRTNSCSLNISDARMSDTGSYVFRVERGNNVQYTYRDKKLNLQVTGTTSLLLSPETGTQHPHSGASGVRPPHTPDLQPARVLRRGKTSDLHLGGGSSLLSGPPGPPLLSANLHPEAPGPWHQPHLSGETRRFSNYGENHPAQCVLCPTEPHYTHLLQKCLR
ncbi:sialic acid-binding Ig-like lectin 14 isoform 2-T2 [Hipposideros larvatus]